MKIDNISGELSVYKKKIIITINEEIHDISNLFPEHNYPIDKLYEPLINWKIRVKICDVIRKYVSELDETFPVDRIIT